MSNRPENQVGDHHCSECGSHGGLNFFMIDENEAICEHCMFDEYSHIDDRYRGVSYD